MIWGGGENGVVGGLTNNEINAIFMQRIPVKIVGIPFRITSQGKLYYAIHVTRINLLDPSPHPEPVYLRGFPFIPSRICLQVSICLPLRKVLFLI